MKKGIRFFGIIGAITFLIALDQVSKYIIRLQGGFYVCNPHIAFGIPIPAPLFWIFWIAILAVIIIRLGKTKKEEKGFEYWGLLLVLVGAVANLVDRWALGCVMDFVDLKVWLPAGMVWPLFNLADVFIVSGAFLWLAKFRKI